MPFNYNSRGLGYNPASSQLIEQASKSPFEIAGNAMSGLEDAIDTRIFARDAKGADSLEKLAMLTPRTEESQKLYKSKQDALSALGTQKHQADMLGLQKDMFGHTQTQAPIVAQAKVDAATTEHLRNIDKYDSSDYVPTNGKYQKFDISKGGTRTPVGTPLTYEEMVRASGGTPAKPSYTTYFNPANPEAAPVEYVQGAQPKGMIPLSDAESYKKTYQDVTNYVGVDNKPLTPTQNTAVEKTLEPFLRPDTREVAVENLFDKMSRGIFSNPDTTPTNEQADAIKITLAEMAMDKKTGFNMAAAIDSPTEMLGLINKHRKSKGQSTFEQEPWYWRILEKAPFGESGLETIMPKDEKSLVNQFFLEQGGYDQKATRPTEPIFNIR